MPPRTMPSPPPLVKQRLLANVMMQAERVDEAVKEQERRIVQGYKQGCSLRELATAARFGSHHKVQELLVRHKIIRADNRKST